MTDSFSQRDIRALTYLGYLGVNTPKYTILAHRLAEKDSKCVFAIKERGKQKTIIKTAEQISSDERIIGNLNQKDAHMVGYISANEERQKEITLKEEALKNISKSSKDSKC